MLNTILGIFTHLNMKHLYIFLLVLAYFVGSVLFYRKIFSDPELKKFFLDSLRESNTGKASGKSLTAFLLSNIVAVATIIAVIYAPNHILPEFFLISVLTFIASLYGISMASKYVSGGNGNGQAPANSVTEKEEEKDKKKEEENKKTPSEDIG